LSDVDKFNYLRNLLERSAAGAIRKLPLTAENYGAAKEILKKRFGLPQIIINAHMEGLVKVAPVTVDNDLKRLRFLYDRVEAHVRALQTLGIQCESYGETLGSPSYGKTTPKHASNNLESYRSTQMGLGCSVKGR